MHVVAAWAPRSLRRVADWTFETTAAIRLDAFIMVGNEASNRMVERAGFAREGVAPRVGPASRRRPRRLHGLLPDPRGDA